MHNGAFSDQARVLAWVSELDASPAPATEIAARRLVAVVDALVPGDLSMVCLGHEAGISNVQHHVEGRRLDADLSSWSRVPRAEGARGRQPIRTRHASSAAGREHPVIAFHDSTGILITGRRADVGSLGSIRPALDFGHFWRPFGIENMVGAPVDFPNEHAYLASYRAARDFSDGDIRLLDQLRSVASRLLRRAAVSRLAEESASAWDLTPREAEVFAFVGLGRSLPSIASLLGLSVGTVRTQLGKAYKKAAVRSRAAATSAFLDLAPTALRQAGHGLVPGEGASLTPQEIVVLRIAASGRTTSAIASVAGISTETAKTHLANVYRKLGVQNRSQALLVMGTANVSLGGSEQLT